MRRFLVHLHIFIFFSFLFTSSLHAIPSDLYQVLKESKIPPTPFILVVCANNQTLSVYKKGSEIKKYKISTSKKGLGQIVNSEMTPLGLHRICSKFGGNADPYTIFRARKNMGEIWSSKKKYKTDDLVLTRILCLEGLQEGHNLGSNEKGLCVDSHKRLIYIHATNHEEDLGKPASKGCIRMSTSDIIELYDEVPDSSLVWICD